MTFLLKPKCASVLLLSAVALFFTTLVFVAPSMAEEPKFYKFNKKGQLIRPEGYREWIFIGTPVTPNELNNGKAAFPEFHHVYIDRESYKVYKKTGMFRDGTIIMKELVSVGSKQAPSGSGYFTGEYIGLEATIKDSKHFKKEPGNWAYFSFTQEGTPILKDVADAFPTASCNSCHDAFAKEGVFGQDFVFTKYYPVLNAARPK